MIEIRRFLLASSCFGASFLTQVASAQESALCQPNEKIVFSCPLQNGKTVSFCGAPVAGKMVYVEYRYGGADKIELRYRAAVGSAKKIYLFDGVAAEGWGASTPTLFFKNGKYGYFLSVSYSPALKAYEAPTLFVNLEGSDYLDSANEFTCAEDKNGKGVFSMDVAPPHPALTQVTFPSFKAWQSRFRRTNSYHTNP